MQKMFAWFTRGRVILNTKSWQQNFNVNFLGPPLGRKNLRGVVKKTGIPDMALGAGGLSVRRVQSMK